MLEVFAGKTADEIAAVIARLSPQSRAVLALEVSRAKENRPFMAPDPKNPKQCLAFNIEAQEIWYGGAAFGGKTYCASGMASMNHSRTTIFLSLIHI